MTAMRGAEIALYLGGGAVFGMLLACLVVAVHAYRTRRTPPPEPVTPEELRTLARDMTRLARRIRDAAEQREEEQLAGDGAPRHAGANV